MNSRKKRIKTKPNRNEKLTYLDAACMFSRALAEANFAAWACVRVCAAIAVIFCASFCAAILPNSNTLLNGYLLNFNLKSSYKFVRKVRLDWVGDGRQHRVEARVESGKMVVGVRVISEVGQAVGVVEGVLNYVLHGDATNDSRENREEQRGKLMIDLSIEMR